MMDIKNIIESLLFVGGEPLTIERIKQVLPFTDKARIQEALNQLAEEYETRKGGFFLREAAGGFQLCTRPEYAEWIRILLQSTPRKLSKPAMETLSIIAYKQPIIRSEIEYHRGNVDCGGIIRMLMERKLVKVIGRKEIPGRPLIYVTTKRFLEVFGLNDLKDLPSPEEIEEMKKPREGAFTQKPLFIKENNSGEGQKKLDENPYEEL
jgi:segregation and condensation protein B